MDTGHAIRRLLVLKRVPSKPRTPGKLFLACPFPCGYAARRAWQYQATSTPQVVSDARPSWYRNRSLKKGTVMLFSSLLRPLRPRWARTDRQTRQQAPRRGGLRLTVEQLEDRRLLSGSLVGNLVVFGDSLSHTGTVALSTGGALPNPGLYYQARFSNAPISLHTLPKHLRQ